MTAIIGYADGEHVWMAGDSRGLVGWEYQTLTTKKVFRCGDLLIGGSGVLRHLNLLRMNLPPMYIADDCDDEVYIAVIVASAVRHCLRGADTSLNEEVDGAQTALMIGYRGRIYQMTSKLCVDSSAEQVYFFGSGGDLAGGAFMALKKRLDIEDAMIESLMIASQFNVTVGAPFYVECLQGESEGVTR